MEHATKNEFLLKVRNLNVNKSLGRRKPHKPLLLMIAIAKLINGEGSIPFQEVKEILTPLLNAYAPPVKSRHQPELPYWHLQSDQIWYIEGADTLPLQKGGFPRLGTLGETKGQIIPQYAELLNNDPEFAQKVVHELLDDFFPESVHDLILDQIGLNLSATIKKHRKRDPQFRPNVLRAYEHRCAVTGFRVALGRTYFGVEAAHVRWHAYSGADSVSNGIALEPTIHKLFDAGAWSLTDDCRIIVSSDFTGTDEAIHRLRSRHGEKLRDPLPGFPHLDPENIQWHREPEQGGVFRQPAMKI